MPEIGEIFFRCSRKGVQMGVLGALKVFDLRISSEEHSNKRMQIFKLTSFQSIQICWV